MLPSSSSSFLTDDTTYQLSIYRPKKNPKGKEEGKKICKKHFCSWAYTTIWERDRNQHQHLLETYSPQRKVIINYRIIYREIVFFFFFLDPSATNLFLPFPIVSILFLVWALVMVLYVYIYIYIPSQIVSLGLGLSPLTTSFSFFFFFSLFFIFDHFSFFLPLLMRSRIRCLRTLEISLFPPLKKKKKKEEERSQKKQKK